MDEVKTKMPAEVHLSNFDFSEVRKSQEVSLAPQDQADF